MPAKGSDRASILAWVKDLTFKEVHAMTYGAVHGAGMAIAFSIGLPEIGYALLLAAFALNGWMSAERTKETPRVDAIIGSLPKGIVGQIRDELHYYDVCFVLGAVAVRLAIWIGLP